LNVSKKFSSEEAVLFGSFTLGAAVQVPSAFNVPAQVATGGGVTLIAAAEQLSV
jgi:hypothetical protein